MWIKTPGKINDRLDYLGTQENCLYLLRASKYMIIGGGMALAVPHIDRQLASMDLEPAQVAYLVVLHSHADHCGAVPFLKRTFPHSQVLASEHAANTLAKQKVTAIIADTNERTIEGLELSEEDKKKARFDGISVDRIVGENDVIDLGDGINVTFIETPGHSRCSITAHVPAMKAIFTSEATPIVTTNGDSLIFTPSPQYDFDKYRESIAKLLHCQPEITALGHHGVFLGDQAMQVIVDGLKAIEQWQDFIISGYKKTGDIEGLVETLIDMALAGYQVSFLDRDILRIACGAEARCVLRSAGLLQQED